VSPNRVARGHPQPLAGHLDGVRISNGRIGVPPADRLDRLARLLGAKQLSGKFFDQTGIQSHALDGRAFTRDRNPSARPVDRLHGSLQPLGRAAGGVLEVARVRPDGQHAAAYGEDHSLPPDSDRSGEPQQ